MLQIQSAQKLEQMEPALSRAAQRHGANLIAAIPVGVLVNNEAPKSATDAISFTICHAEIYTALLSADIRFAAFLPCRIAAMRNGEGVALESIPPSLFCSHLERSDLTELTAPLEHLLIRVMEDVSVAANAAITAHAAFDGGLGANETQMSMRGSIPQRIDGRGTKIEDLAGTGDLDTPGG